jgi:hypothetical protein
MVSVHSTNLVNASVRFRRTVIGINKNVIGSRKRAIGAWFEGSYFGTCVVLELKESFVPSMVGFFSSKMDGIAAGLVTRNDWFTAVNYDTDALNIRVSHAEMVSNTCKAPSAMKDIA